MPELNFIDDRAGKPVGIHAHIGRRPIAAFGNSDGDWEMLEWTQAGSGPRLVLLIHHDDAVREFAYGAESKIGTFSDALMAEAKKNGWINKRLIHGPRLAVGKRNEGYAQNSGRHFMDPASFGIVLKGLANVGACLCFRLGKAFYDVLVRQRPASRVGVDLVLESVVASTTGLVMDALLPQIDIPTHDGQSASRAALSLAPSS